MKILVVASQKGGAGKSTIARACAVAAVYDGIPSAILDADPQHTCMKWSQRREAPAPSVVAVDGATLRGTIQEMQARGAGLVVIDTPPHLRSMVSMAAELADAALIPVRPSIDDLEAVGDTVAILRALDRKAGIVINQAKTGGATVVGMARSGLSVMGYPICPTAVVDRIAHQHAANVGLTAQEYDTGSKAAEDITAVWAWVRATLL